MKSEPDRKVATTGGVIKKVVIATTTFYKLDGKDNTRFKLAQEMVKKAVAAGYTVVIVDESPISTIKETLSALGAKVFPQLHQGMGPGRRQAFFHATEIGTSQDADVILWTEPEKVGLIDFVPKIVAQVGDGVGEYEIMIPRRSDKSWKSWPVFQRKTEQFANRRYNQLFGFEGEDRRDPMFGPVAFTILASHLFTTLYSKRLGIDVDTYIQHWAPIVADAAENLAVGSVEIDMIYPPEQREEEENALSEEMKKKRIMQRDTLVRSYEQLKTLLTRLADTVP